MLLILDFKILQSVIFIIQQSKIVLQEKKYFIQLLLLDLKFSEDILILKQWN